MVVPRGTRIWRHCASRHHCNRSLFELISGHETWISLWNRGTRGLSYWGLLGRYSPPKTPRDGRSATNCLVFSVAPALHRSQLIKQLPLFCGGKFTELQSNCFVPFLDLSVIGEQVPLVWLPSQPHLTGGPTPPLEKILLNFSDPVFLAYFCLIF